MEIPADFKSEAKTGIADIRPTLPIYLKSSRNDGRDEPLAVSTRRATCGAARRFFQWAKREHARRYGSINLNWLDSLKTSERISRTLNDHKLYTLDEVRKLIALSVETLTQQRDQAAVAFLFLSGARDGAFVSLPINAVDLKNRAVKQLPELGVKTKFQKAAITYLLNIPDLLEIVERWDNLVRGKLSPDALWYATLSRDGMDFTGKTEHGKGRASAVRKGLEKLCRRAGISYCAPHHLRHGHAVYAFSFARDIVDRQAIKQNLMHGKCDTTDIYIWLPDNEVAERIASLTHQAQSAFSTDIMLIQLAQLLEGNNNTALVNEIADAVAERLSNKTGSTLQAGHPH